MDRASVLDALKDPMGLPPEFKNWLIKYIEVNPPSIPLKGLLGFTEQTPGYELGYWELTSLINVAAVSTPIFAAQTFVADGKPVIVELFLPYVSTPSAAAGNLTEFVLAVDGSQKNILGYIATPAAAQLKMPFRAAYRWTPSEGEHTVAVSAAATNTTGTPQAGGGTGTVSSGFPPAFLRVTKV